MSPGGGGMKSPVAFQPRERRLALIAGIVISCWAFLSLLLQPLWEQVRDLRLEVQTHTDRLESLGSLLSRAPAIERDYQVVAAYLEEAGEGTGEQGTFLNELEALSRASQVRLNLKPRPVRVLDERVSRFEVELDVEGLQPNLMGFLDTLLRMPALIEIERLRISAVPVKINTLRATVVIQKLSL